jgi:hypothetical protein
MTGPLSDFLPGIESPYQADYRRGIPHFDGLTMDQVRDAAAINCRESSRAAEDSERGIR